MQPCYPYGYVTEVTPKPPPWMWRIGPVRTKTYQPPPGSPGQPAADERIIVQLTADQQVQLTITGEDAYGNPVDVSGDTVWSSSDESIVTVEADSDDPTKATAVAVGPTGTAAVTVSNDVNSDGTGDFLGSLAIDVVAGDIAEIVIQTEEPTDKE